MNSTEPQVENLVAAIDDAFKTGIVPAVTADAPSNDVSNVTVPFDPNLKWQTPEAYTSETGKRFRMTKAELAQYAGSVTPCPPEARQAAFVARQNAGLLG